MSWPRRCASDDASRVRGPATYAEWSAWFDAFAQGGDDDALLASASTSELAWSAATANLYATRAATALGERLDRVGAMLEAGLRRMRNERDLAQAIVDARRAFGLLRRYAELASWPETLRIQLGALIDHHVRTRQEAMVKSAAGDRSGRLANVVRNTPLDRARPAMDQPLPADRPDWTASSPSHRTILR